MKDTTKTDMSVELSDRDQSGVPEIDSKVEVQTRTRRLFSTSQLFAYSLTYMSVWEALCG